MKVYIAGNLSIKKDREFLEDIDKLCKKLKLETFLPHRDVGLWEDVGDVELVAKKDLDEFKNCKLLVASLNGFNIGAGTAWEMGYAHANNIPVIAIKTDREVSVEEVSAIIFGLTKIVTSLKDLENEIRNLV